ncbi:MAG: NADPH:quinone reductase [Candidatus Nanopelagicales bacterium]|jgi:NADPH:quinone reductase|nr:NADPH:quinone reductase [Candidatus Nanopelagicales bacterium]MDP4887612.1 NADPH:quinone reductase [Candidatus Nanopelagicales bacterium]
MRAAIYSQHGPSSVMTVLEVTTPGPGPGEVRVRLETAGVNPTDFKVRSAGPSIPFDFQVPCHDGAGVVEAVGPGVDPSRIGERVWVYLAAHQRQWGTAAQYTVVPARQAVPLPEGISNEQAAGLGVPYLTAHACLFDGGKIDGATVLVAGGAGAVGHAAIELAVRAGAHVIATVSSAAKAAIAKAAGAHVVVNYTDADAAAQIRAAARAGVDRIIEVALGANLSLDLDVIAPHGTIVTYASEATDPVLPTRALMNLNVTVRYVILYGFTPAMLAAGVADITEALTGGALSALPLHRFTLEQAAAAFDAVEANTVGKVILDIE